MEKEERHKNEVDVAANSQLSAKESRCFALTSNDLFGSALFSKHHFCHNYGQVCFNQNAFVKTAQISAFTL